jgi:hypothetical protein
MGRYFGLFFLGLFKKSFWADRWQTFLSIVRNAPEYFKGAGKAQWNEDAYLLGMTATFLSAIPGGFLFWGLISLVTGLASTLILPLILLCGLVMWALGVVVVYYIAAWLYGLAIQWVMGAKPDMNKVRPIVFVCIVGTPLSLTPGLGGLLTFALTIVLLVVAYENALSSPRGQAIGMGLLGMVLNGVFFVLVSLGLGALVTMATLGAGTAFAALGSFIPASLHKPAPVISEQEPTPIAKVSLSAIYGSMTQEQKLEMASDKLVEALNKAGEDAGFKEKGNSFTYQSIFIMHLEDQPEIFGVGGWNVPLAARKIAYDKIRKNGWDHWQSVVPKESFNDFDAALQDTLVHSMFPLSQEAAAVFGPEPLPAQASASTGASGSEDSHPAVQQRPKARAKSSETETSSQQEQTSAETEPTPVPQEDRTKKAVEKAAGNLVKQGLGKALGF